jgi:hypothetical protein
LAALVVLAGAAGAAGELSHASKANRSEARADAARQLSLVSLPPGAARLDSRRAYFLLRPALFTCRGRGAGFTPYTNVISRERYRQVPDDPSGVMSWLRAHAPQGSKFVFSGQTTTRTGGTVQTLIFDFPADRGRVVQRCVGVAVKRRASGGGSAVGIVSEATWVLTRPRWDYIPHRVRLVTVTLNLAGGRSRPVTLAESSTVSRIVRLIDRSTAPQPEMFHCPLGLPETYRLVFRARRDGPALARATADLNGCAALWVTVDGRRGPLLDAADRLGMLLPGIGAVTPCARSNLSLSAQGVHAWHGQHWASYQLTNRRGSPCELAHRITVTLLGQNGQPLPIPITYTKTFLPWLLGPKYPVEIAVSWTHSCSRRQVATVRIAIASQPPSFTNATGKHRFPPCQAIVRQTTLYP